jgi:ferric-dicitrate binding protein FerR (iron transport regulator)
MSIPSHIRRIADRYLSGTATPEECVILDEWYRSFDDRFVELPADAEGHPDRLGERMRTRLMGDLREPGVVSMRPRYRSWMRVAAALLLLAGLGLGIRMIWFRSAEVIGPATLTRTNDHPLTPGSDRAWLRLGDGSVVYLDSTAPGFLASQAGLQLEKKADGSIVYQTGTPNTDPAGTTVFNEIRTPRGGQYQVILSDGTHVWLNAETTLRFPVAFRGKDRKVDLSGEAYFEVAKDEQRPFRVMTDASLVEVFGTHFNVNAYTDEGSVKTTLLEGRVGVGPAASGSGGAMRMLSPGQQAAVKPDGTVNVNDRADTEEAIAWKNGRFHFNSADIRAIMRQIARWYDAEVIFEGDPDLHFTGQITRRDEVSRVLQMMEMTGEVRFRVEGRRIYVKK